MIRMKKLNLKCFSKNELNRNVGITLIALVISIVVLLILAGVSIVTLTGDNGVLSRTTSAKQKTELATFKEKLNLAYMSAYTDNAKNGTYTVSMTDMLNQLVIDYPEYGQEGKIVDGTQGGIKAMWGTTEVNATNGVLVSTTSPEMLNIVPTNPLGEEVTKFVVIDGKYYEIILDGNGVNLGEAQNSIQTSEQTIDFTAEVLTGLSGVTVTPATSGNGKTVTISGESATSGTIGISYGEYDITVKVDVKVLYTVSFYKESGDSEVYETKKVEPGQTIGSTNMPRNPSKNAVAEETYTFAGWKYNSTEFTGNTAVTENISVYGEFTATASPSKSYVGYYIFKDEEYAIIYADLLAQQGTTLTWSNTNNSQCVFPNANASDFKSYTISSTTITPTSTATTGGVFGPNYEITPEQGTSGKDRFLAMTLSDFPMSISGDYKSYYFYKTAKKSRSSGTMSDYSSNTNSTTTIGYGITNTANMISKWDLGSNEGGYGVRTTSGTFYDVWQDVKPKVDTDATATHTDGWFIPSFAEWCAFAKMSWVDANSTARTIVDTDGKKISTYNIYNYYWSSSQGYTMYAWETDFNSGYMRNRYVDEDDRLRFSTTF